MNHSGFGKVFLKKKTFDICVYIPTYFKEYLGKETLSVKIIKLQMQSLKCIEGQKLTMPNATWRAIDKR
jgi:hypothetical protein